MISLLWHTTLRGDNAGRLRSQDFISSDGQSACPQLWTGAELIAGSHFYRRPDGTKTLRAANSGRVRVEVLAAEAFYRLRAIGVSNFEERHLEELISVAKIKPAVNQVEVHPRLPQTQLLAACKKLGIVVTAYSPFGAEGAELLQHRTVIGVSQAVNRPPAQVLLQWSLQKGCIVIPKSTNEQHIQEWGVGQEPWQLDDASMKALDSMAADRRRYLWDPTDVA